MTNQEILQKMREDMEMRGFSKYTKDSVNCQVFFNKNSHIKLSNYSHVIIKTLGVLENYPALFLFSAKYLVR